jgi:hypothetical protein
MSSTVRVLGAVRASQARLPANYEAAKQALARCEQVDECKDWINKAAAIAEYARQAKDDTLVIMAQRIQARAIRRMGELLKEIPHVRGVCARGAERSRTSVATGAGLTRLQREQAARIAQVPAQKFERLIESPKPPKVRELAALGTRKNAKRTAPSLHRALELAEAQVARFETRLANARARVEQIRQQLKALERG